MASRRLARGHLGPSDPPDVKRNVGTEAPRVGKRGNLRPVGAVPSSTPPPPAPQWSAPVAWCGFGFRTERCVFSAVCCGSVKALAGDTAVQAALAPWRGPGLPLSRTWGWSWKSYAGLQQHYLKI